MTFESAEQWRATKRRKGEEVSNKTSLDRFNESGLTNFFGVAMPDTRDLTVEQVGTVLDLYWDIRESLTAGGEGLRTVIAKLMDALRGQAVAATDSAMAG